MIEIPYSDYVSRYQLDNAAVIPEEKFLPFLSKAEQVLDNLLMGNLHKIADTEAAKHCLCEIAELLFKTALRQGIKSEDNDGYRVTYGALCVENGACEIAARYLSATGLMYRGIG